MHASIRRVDTRTHTCPGSRGRKGRVLCIHCWRYRKACATSIPCQASLRERVVLLYGFFHKETCKSVGPWNRYHTIYGRHVQCIYILACETGAHTVYVHTNTMYTRTDTMCTHTHASNASITHTDMLHVQCTCILIHRIHTYTGFTYGHKTMHIHNDL